MRRVVVVFIVTAVIMLFIFDSAGWYANNAAMPRYCEKPSETIEIVREILTTPNPSEGQEKRPYIVAAKLIFLEPQLEAESIDAYMLRLRDRISQACGTPF